MAFDAASASPMLQTQQQQRGEKSSASELGLGLQEYQQQVVNLQRQVHLMDRQRDGVQQVRALMRNLDEFSSHLAKSLSCFEREIETRPRGEIGVLRARHQKLQKDFRMVHQQYTDIQTLATIKLEAVPSSDVREMAPQTQGSAAPEHHQTRSQMSVHDDAINEEIMREREEEIRGIHQTVTKVNEVFKDLADIVHEQQQEIDAVQSMIGRSHEHAQSGLRQVEKASETQESTCGIS
mmetsp:Transcript_16648/g.33969  ORF Transcript_16648/g.33969 Transcript_16648/m.33969 type:complete len:237 (+) Transcript_16648:160-870(+)